MLEELCHYAYIIQYVVGKKTHFYTANHIKGKTSVYDLIKIISECYSLDCYLIDRKHFSSKRVIYKNVRLGRFARFAMVI